MIGIIFSFFNDIVEVRVDGFNCLFRTGKYGNAFVPIDGLKLDKNGVIKQHPDLKDKDNWREESIRRYKEHMKTIDSEIKRIEYIKKELTKLGYRPLYMQRAGHRPQKLT